MFDTLFAVGILAMAGALYFFFLMLRDERRSVEYFHARIPHVMAVVAEQRERDENADDDGDENGDD